MAKRVDHFRQSDVTVWGVVALTTAAIALVGSSFSALLPDNLMTGLHATRLQGGNLNALSAQVAALGRETAEMQELTAILRAQFALADQSQNLNTRRVAALELALPTLMEALPPGATIDRSLLTASVSAPNAEMQEAEGGFVSVNTSPLFAEQGGQNTNGGAVPVASAQPMPDLAALAPPDGLISPSGFGMAVGPSISATAAVVTWEKLTGKIGTLLIGLEPLLAWDEMSGARRIVVGPLERFSQAEQLCALVSRTGIGCLPVDYSGTPVDP